MKRFIGVLITVCLLFSLSACLGGEKESITLYVPIDSEPVSLDPQIAFGYGDEVIVRNCFEGLLRIDSDGTVDFGVATKYDVSSDGLTYTFFLNKDAEWHLTAEHKKTLGEDGFETFDTSLTANDFVFAFRRALNPETGAAYASKLFCIKNAEQVCNGTLSDDNLGIKALDKHTLQITLAYKDSSFLHTLASPVAMPCSEKFFELTGGKYGLELDYILCNGPLYVTSWTHGNSVFIKKNADYNGKAQVKASMIGLMINKDSANRLSLLVSGSYDCDFADAKAVSMLSDVSSLNLSKLQDRVWGLAFNTDAGALKNLNIRKALFCSFDCSLIEPSAYVGDRVTSVVPQGCIIGDQEYSSLSNTGIAYPYSEKTALDYWNKGLLELKSDTVSVTITCSKDFRSSVDKIVQKWQQVFGISLSIKINEVTDIELMNSFKKNNYEMSFVPLESDSFFADEFIEKLCINTLDYKNSKLDEYIMQMKKQTESGKKAEAVGTIEKLLYDDCVFYPVFSGYTYFATYKETEGLYYYISKNNLALYSGARYE